MNAKIIHHTQINNYKKAHLQMKEKNYIIISIDEGFPDSSVGKESTCNAGDLGLIPGLGRSPGEGKVIPLQYPGTRTQLSDFHSKDKSKLLGHKRGILVYKLIPCRLL